MFFLLNKGIRFDFGLDYKLHNTNITSKKMFDALSIETGRTVLQFKFSIIEFCGLNFRRDCVMFVCGKNVLNFVVKGVYFL